MKRLILLLAVLTTDKSSVEEFRINEQKHKSGNRQNQEIATNIIK